MMYLLSLRASKTLSKSENNEIETKDEPLSPSSLLEEQYEMPLTHESLSENYPDNDTNDVIDVAPTDSLYSRFPKLICETSMVSTTEDYSNPVSGNTVFSNRLSLVDEEDYDKMFLLSLLPMMRKLSEDKKLDVRIQMQQILVQAIRGDN